MKPGQILQNARRNMFGSRWFYILKELNLGYHVLITDVDNLFQKYKAMQDFEESIYDIVHTFCGEINAFPQYVYNRLGFTVCGGMSWLRSTTSVIEFVSELARRCGCLKEIGCDCFCDDQVTINRMYLEGPFRGVWNQKPHQKIIARTTEEMYWDGFDGVCPKTGHKLLILDRNTAWRGTMREDMKCPNNTWVAMPQGQRDKSKTRELWNKYCKSDDEY